MSQSESNITELESGFSTWLEKGLDSPLRTSVERIAIALRQFSHNLHDGIPTLEQSESLAELAENLLEASTHIGVRDRIPSMFDELREDTFNFFDHSPLSGPLSPVSVPLNLAIEGDKVVGRVNFGASFEGPPGHVHGGWVASAFDEVMGMVQAHFSEPGMTRKLAVRYQKPTPLNTDLIFVAWIESIRGRKIVTRAEAFNGDEQIADAEGLFISVDFEALRSSLKQKSGNS